MTSPFSVVATGQSLIHQDLRGVADSRLDAVIALIRRADLAFTNFEMTVLGSHGGWPLKGSYFGYAEPVVLDCLKSMGFSVLSLANNHAFDLGPPGILSTMEEARRLGFIYAGTGQDLQSAEAPGKGKAAGRAIGLVAMDAGPGPAFMYAADAKGTRPARPGVNELKVERRFDVDERAFAVLQHLQRQVGTTQLELANYAQPNDPPQTDGTNENRLLRNSLQTGPGYTSTGHCRSEKRDPPALCNPQGDGTGPVCHCLSASPSLGARLVANAGMGSGFRTDLYRRRCAHVRQPRRARSPRGRNL